MMNKQELIKALVKLGAYCDELERIEDAPDLETALAESGTVSLDWISSKVNHPANAEYKAIVFYHASSKPKYKGDVMDAEFVATINSATSKYLAKLRNTTLDEWIALIEKATRQ